MLCNNGQTDATHTLHSTLSCRSFGSSFQTSINVLFLPLTFFCYCIVNRINFFSCTLFHTYPKLVKTSWVHFHQSSDGLNRGKAAFKSWANSSACGVCVYHPCCVLLLCSSSLSHQFSALLFLFRWFQLLLLDEDEELSSLPQRNYTPKDITLNLMFSLIFKLNRLGLGLGFRINKRFYKYSSHWVTVVLLRFIFISKIRQKFTPTSVFLKNFISKLCKLINHMSIDFLYHFPFYG